MNCESGEYHMFWNTVLDPFFLITFGLVALAFAPLLISIWLTWEENPDD